MTSINYLPDEMQLSDDFTMFTDGVNYYASRGTEEGGSFIVKNKNYWVCLTDALDKFQEFVLSHPEPKLTGTWDDEKKEVTWHYQT